MRVTGDCFFFAAARLVGRFTAGFLRGAADFDALRVLAPRFVALFDLLFALPVLREAARFDAVDDLRAFRPDDFDAVAMIIFLVKVQAGGAQDSRAQKDGELRRAAESLAHCGLQPRRDVQLCRLIPGTETFERRRTTHDATLSANESRSWVACKRSRCVGRLAQFSARWLEHFSGCSARGCTGPPGPDCLIENGTIQSQPGGEIRDSKRLLTSRICLGESPVDYFDTVVVGDGGMDRSSSARVERYGSVRFVRSSTRTGAPRARLCHPLLQVSAA
jgi:hypothetical protein